MTSGPIQNPRSKIAGRRPGDGTFRNILDGEIFVNQADGAIVTKAADGSLIENSLTNPTAPTRPLNEQSTRVANMQALYNALAPLIGGVPPATLNSIKEIADALGDDPNAFADLMALIADCVRFDQNQTLTAGQRLQARANIGALAQGTGPDQSPGNIVALGLGVSVNALKASVDGTDFGRIWTDRDGAVSLGSPGYMRLPNGWIFQMAKVTAGQTWTFPTAFPTLCVGVFANPTFDQTNSAVGVSGLNTTKTSSYIQANYSNNSSQVGPANGICSVIAVGY